jgi:hypothetical protein
MESEKFKDKAGERIETTRTLLEISDEIKL